MKWKYETPEERIKRLEKWHKKFAWFPIKIDGTKYWLEFVERRMGLFIAATHISDPIFYCEYRPIRK